MGWGEILFPNKPRNTAIPEPKVEPAPPPPYVPEKYTIKVSTFLLKTGPDNNFETYHAKVKGTYRYNPHYQYFKKNKINVPSEACKQYIVFQPFDVLKYILLESKYIETVEGFHIRTSDIVGYKELSTEEEEIEL